MQEMQETLVRSPGWQDPLEKEMETYSGTLPGKSHRQRSLVGYSLWGHKASAMTEHTHTLSYNIYHFFLHYIGYLLIVLIAFFLLFCRIID